MKDPKAMYSLSYGLFVLSSATCGRDNACITNTAIQVTSSPNRIAVAVNKGNFTHALILESGVFTASVISRDATFDLFRRFGFQSGRDVNKFHGFAGVRRLENGTLAVTEGTCAWISAKVVQTVDLGTHTLFVADVTDGETLSSAEPATYAYYQANIKPKPAPRPAPDPDAVPAGRTASGKTVWRCRICGYEWVGEELPADFVCPVCKHPASDFEKVSG